MLIPDVRCHVRQYGRGWSFAISLLFAILTELQSVHAIFVVIFSSSCLSNRRGGAERSTFVDHLSNTDALSHHDQFLLLTIFPHAGRQHFAFDPDQQQLPSPHLSLLSSHSSSWHAPRHVGAVPLQEHLSMSKFRQHLLFSPVIQHAWPDGPHLLYCTSFHPRSQYPSQKGAVPTHLQRSSTPLTVTGLSPSKEPMIVATVWGKSLLLKD
jgi:hypothetical protein